MGKSLEIGNLVRLKPGDSKYKKDFKIVGFSESGNVAFLQPIAFVNRSRREHAIAWMRGDLVKTT